jgi:hypothetical protein
MKRMLGGAALLAALVGVWATAQAGGDKKDGWVQLFNGKDLTGWKTHPKNPGKWYVQDGILHSGGKEVSHLFTERGDYENFHFRIEAKINDLGNSGQYFRCKFLPGYPIYYEAQINSTFPDPKRTGSLYKFVDIKEMLVPPDTWFTQEVIANGNHIQIILNGKKVVDFVDEKKTETKGHLALQHHSAAKLKDGSMPECHLQVKKIEVKELPPSK